MATKTTIDQLNTLLRDELIAIATYGQALEGRSAYSGKTELSLCQRSHEKRAEILREEIEILGGVPAEKTGLRGVVASVVEGGAVVVGEGAALRALEEWEEKELRDYLQRCDDLEPQARQIVKTRLLPEQLETHRVMTDLKHRASAAD
ncbi:MAG: DUF2383 domain-containing protein [Polyangiaceae bacterium]|jgi:Domain of unknown function (DUF2383)